MRRRAGVYVLVQDGEPVYVGASRNVDLRVNGWRARTAASRRPLIAFDTAFVLELPESEIWLYERALIYALLPDRNSKVIGISDDERAVIARLGLTVRREGEAACAAVVSRADARNLRYRSAP